MPAATLTPSHEVFAPREMRTYRSAKVSFASTGDKDTFAPANPIVLVRWGFINVDSAIVNVGANMVVSLEKRTTAGSDAAGRSAISTITTTSNIALGKGLYSDFNIANFSGQTTGVDLSTVNVAPSDTTNAIPIPELVVPGEELVVNVTDAADVAAANLVVFYHYYEQPFVTGLITNLTKKAT